MTTGWRERDGLLTAVFGARAGAVTGLLCALADLASGWRSASTEGLLPFAAILLGVLVPLATLGGALAALWIFVVWRGRLAEQSPRSALRTWLLVALSSLPLVLGLFWVPWSWLSEHWDGLKGDRRAMAVGVYAAMALSALVAVRAVVWITARYRAAERLPRFHWPLLAMVLAFAGTCYWADRTFYTGSYRDFHYGLAGTFYVAAGTGVVLLIEALRRTKRFGPALASVRNGELLAAALLISTCLLTWVTGLSGIRDRQAVLYDKAVLAIQNQTDFDGDGYSSWLGGLDCAPFDAGRSPHLVDYPGNGVDEDCTGSDARWPIAAAKPDYDVPQAAGFNVLLITVDTLRADRMSVYGHKRRTTPNLERLARESLVFDRAYAPATKTWDSMASIMTGLYPSNQPRNYQHPRLRNAKPYMFVLTSETVTLGELFKQRGYETHAALSLGMLKTLGLGAGFEHLQVSRDVSKQAIRVLRSAPRPFLLWLHYIEPHDAYVKHKGFDFGDSAIDRYDSEVARVDQLIGTVLDALRKSEHADDTVVVVTADHGEEFWEHGGEHHTYKLYEEILHVPLLIRMPGMAARRIGQPVEVLDLAPTLCEAVALLPDCTSFDGQSLWRTLAGKRDSSFGFAGVYAETKMKEGVLVRRSLRDDNYRLNVHLDQQNVEFFDIRVDPGEQRNIARQRPEEVARLREQMALRPYRRLAEAFQRAEQADASLLLASLSRVRNQSLLDHAVKAIERHSSAEGARALQKLANRPKPSTRSEP